MIANGIIVTASTGTDTFNVLQDVIPPKGVIPALSRDYRPDPVICVIPAQSGSGRQNLTQMGDALAPNSVFNEALNSLKSATHAGSGYAQRDSRRSRKTINRGATMGSRAGAWQAHSGSFAKHSEGASPALESKPGAK
jgi:hypothetical protein